jgi:hypothetical protein
LADKRTADFSELDRLLVGVEQDLDGLGGEVGMRQAALNSVVDGVGEDGKEAVRVGFEETESAGEVWVGGGFGYCSRIVEMELRRTGSCRPKAQIPDKHLRLSKEGH